MATNIAHNQVASRYELTIDDQLIGVAVYHRDGDLLDFTHTEIVPSQGGRGHGTTLVEAALDDVERQSLTVLPHCWFMRDLIAERPAQYLALVPADRRAQFRLPAQ